MSLRKSTILTLAVVFVVMVVAAFFIARAALLDGYTKLEVQGERRNADRVLGTLQNRIDWLAGTTSDWAYWDDTYRFVADLNQTYIDTNLAATTFDSLQLNAILFLDARGSVVCARAYDLIDAQDVPVPAGLLDYVAGSETMRFPGDQPNVVAGIINLGGTPMMVASCPILTSGRGGPPRGALVMARYFDDDEVELLAATAVMDVSFFPLGGASLPEDVQSAYDRLSGGSDPVYINAPDGHVIDTYIVAQDIQGQAAGIFRAERERTVYQQGWTSVMVTLLVLAVAAVVAGFVAVLFQDKRVLSPLVRLRDSVHSVSRSGDLSARVPEKGTDELSALGKDINVMLSTIQQQRSQESKLRENLEQEIRKRSEYTRELVHELKTPITPIMSSSELLVDGVKGEPWNRLARNIYRGALDMNDRLDDLVDIARGEVGALRLREERLDMQPVIDQMAQEMKPLITSRLQTLQLEVASPLPAVLGDETRLRQVLRNLLSNATKYTPERGKITIRAKPQDQGLVIDVQDTGRGIAPDQLERIFEPYAKITDGILERQTGLGLGLKLAKTLVELHKGRMWVKSEKGKGSMFSFYLPGVADAPSRNPRQGAV